MGGWEPRTEQLPCPLTSISTFLLDNNMLMKASGPRGSRLDLEAKLFRGLADLSRLSILEALRGRPRTVSQVVRATGLSQPSASMHLDCLWCCGLVDRETVGRFTVYRLKSRKVLRILEAAEALLVEVRGRIAECRRYDERKARLV